MNSFEDNKLSSRREVVTFRINMQEFGVDILSVREIRGWTAPTVVPHVPAYILGMINLRGVVLPIIDLAARLGLPATDITNRHAIIVVQVAGNLIGLVVDGVSDILTFSAESVQATPDIVADHELNFVPNVLMMDGRMISLIALDEILPLAQREAA